MCCCNGEKKSDVKETYPILGKTRQKLVRQHSRRNGQCGNGGSELSWEGQWTGNMTSNDAHKAAKGKGKTGGSSVRTDRVSLGKGGEKYNRQQEHLSANIGFDSSERGN